MIPKQLQRNDFRFIFINEEKAAIEKAWGKINNYLYDEKKLLDFISNNKKYGIVCGYGNLVIIDFDKEEVQDELINLFPTTFTTKSAGKGLYHLYYICDEQKGFRVNDINGERVADIQGEGTYIVAPNTELKGKKYEIIKDVEISKINMETIRKIFSPYLSMEKTKKKSSIESKDHEVKQIMERIKVPDLLRQWGIPLNKNPTECPFHDSSGGKCLSYNDNLWHCFHCDSGGTVINLVMEKEGLSFYHAKKKLAEQLGIKINNVDLFIPNKEEICENYYSINPYFFDDVGLFWFWDSASKSYVIKDELDLMNDIKSIAAQKNFSIVSGTFWTEMNRALKLIGRSHKPKEWNPNWIQFNDKVYDIKIKEIYSPNKDFFNANPIPHNVGAEDKTPTIDRLFEEWVGADHVLELKELCFYCMLQDYPIHRLFFLFGRGLNGKGKFLEFLLNLIGDRNTTSSSITKLISRDFEVAKLYKKLLCQMGETNFQILEKTEVLKQLSGQDLMSAEFKNKNSFDFKNNAKLVIATNCLPPTLDVTNGWHRRIKIIDFPNQFKEGLNPVKQIPAYEYDNFCFQLIRIGNELLDRGMFSNDGTIEKRQEEYEVRSNPIKPFIQQFYDLDGSSKIPFFEIADKFQKYLQERKYRIMDKKEISLLLEKEGFEKKYDKIYIDGVEKKWLFIYGLIEKQSSIGNQGKSGEVKEVTFQSVFLTREIDSKVTSQTSQTSLNIQKGILDKDSNPYNLIILAIQKLDLGKGVETYDISLETKEPEQLIKQRVGYAKMKGLIYEVSENRWKVTPN